MNDFIVVREAHMNYPDVNLSATERLQQILGSVIMLIRGEMDNTMFEEECHQLVGAGGYVLYTLDKVILSCLKHLHTAFTEPLCNDLIVGVGSLYYVGLLCSFYSTKRSYHCEWISESSVTNSPGLSSNHFPY